MRKLIKYNIGSQVLYIPLYQQPYYKKKYNYNPILSNSQNFYSKCLVSNISFDEIKRRKKISKIINKICKLK